MTMKNEALETHVVRHVRVPRRVDRLVGACWRHSTASSARRLTCGHSRPAPRRRATPEQQAFDGVERFSLTDGSDLARKEILELQLPPGEGQRARHGLTPILASNCPVWSNRSIPRPFRRTTPSGQASRRGRHFRAGALERLQQVLGGIEVAVEARAGTWITAGEVREMGPLATDILVVALPRSATGRVRRVSRKAIGASTTWHRFGSDRGCRARGARADLSAGRRWRIDLQGPLTTLPGDTYTYTFQMPRNGASHAFSKPGAITSNGCAKSGCRTRTPLRAAQLMLNPAQLLRDVAPEFKRQEAQMESLFWGKSICATVTCGSLLPS